MKTFAGSGLILVTGLLGAMFLASAPVNHPVIRVHALAQPYGAAELWEASDLVALVVPIGGQTEQWNNATNTRWEADPESGILPMVFRDESVAVVTLLKGAAPESLTIRNLGGVTDGVEFAYEGLYDLKNGSQYLVFLQAVDTPTETGSERAISFVGQGQGLFTTVDGGFQNSVGLTLTLAELPAK